MSRGRVIGGLTAAGTAMVLVVGSAGPAGADPGAPTDQTIAESVRSLAADDSVRLLAVQDSIVALETEEESGGKTKVTLNSDVLFEFGSAKLTAAAAKRIDEIAAKIGSSGTAVVAGHTDSIGGVLDNLRLSRARAKAVKQRLEAKASGARIVAVGVGEGKPVEPNTQGGEDNPDGRAKNRRVEITFRG